MNSSTSLVIRSFLFAAGIVGMCAVIIVLGVKISSGIKGKPENVKWIEGRQLYAGWSDAVAYPPDQQVKNEKGELVTHRPAGWVRLGVDDETQYGLRDDGVIVWRKVEKKK